MLLFFKFFNIYETAELAAKLQASRFFETYFAVPIRRRLTCFIEKTEVYCFTGTPQLL